MLERNFTSNKKPLVSIVINYLNGIEFIHEALDSVIKQSYENWEIIFFDNGSSDNFDLELRKYKSFASKIKYFKNGETVNLANARNQALKKTQGEFIAFLDCDDLWHKDKLLNQLNAFTEDAIGCVYTNYIHFNKNGLRNTAYQKKMPSGDLYKELMFNDFICFSSLMIRREVFMETQIYFDPVLNFVEDEDFLIRISRDWQFGYIHSVLTDYRMHGNSLTANARLEFRDEEDYLLEIYSKEFDDFGDEESSFYYNILQKNRAVTLWRLGESKNARRIMYLLAFNNLRFFVIYIAMYFNHQHINKLRSFFSNDLSSYEA